MLYNYTGILFFKCSVMHVMNKNQHLVTIIIAFLLYESQIVVRSI